MVFSIKGTQVSYGLILFVVLWSVQMSAALGSSATEEGKDATFGQRLSGKRHGLLRRTRELIKVLEDTEQSKDDWLNLETEGSRWLSDHMSLAGPIRASSAQETFSPTPSPTTTPATPPPIPAPSITADAPPSTTTSPMTTPETPPPAKSPTTETELVDTLTVASFAPGDFSQNKMSPDGILKLSNGLSCNRIAETGQPVQFVDGTTSSELFHDQPDGAGVFMKDDGGWYYVSNAENTLFGTAYTDGGVGAIEFNSNGQMIGYKKVAVNMRRNCGGGKSPWNTWLTCEEFLADDPNDPNYPYAGKVYQVDPKGDRVELTAMGELGWYESFAYDDDVGDVPTFYVTRDHPESVLTRFTPNQEGMECYNQANNADRWCTLNHGTIDYLLISGEDSGTFTWTQDYALASQNAMTFYKNAEGIDSADGKVFFVAKLDKLLYILDLETQTYTRSSTNSGAFDQQPDQVKRLVDDDESILYFCEDNDTVPGIFGRAVDGRYFTIAEASNNLTLDETSGLGFGGGGMHMYFALQHAGFIYDCTRDDGLPFNGEVLDIKYH